MRFTSRRLEQARHMHARTVRLNAVRQITTTRCALDITPENVEARREELLAKLNRPFKRMMRDMILLVTDPSKRITDGGIIIPEAVAGFYAGMPKGKYATGIVLLCGPDVREVKNGERIMFPRINFAWTEKLPDDMLLGWIAEEMVMAVVDPDEEPEVN